MPLPPHEPTRPRPWQSCRYTLAERVACATLNELGYRDPESHPAYGRVLESVQRHLDGSVDAIAGVAFHDGRRKGAEIQDELDRLRFRLGLVCWLACLAVSFSIMPVAIACYRAVTSPTVPTWVEREMGPGVPRPVLPARDR